MVGWLSCFFHVPSQSLRLTCRANIQQHNTSIYRASLQHWHNHLHTDSLIYRHHMHAGTQNHTYTLGGKAIMESHRIITEYHLISIQLSTDYAQSPHSIHLHPNTKYINKLDWAYFDREVVSARNQEVLLNISTENKKEELVTCWQRHARCLRI